MKLVLVAHPDDETLWFGGTLQLLIDDREKIAVISMTNAQNQTRLKEFALTCKYLRIQGGMLNYPDGGDISLPNFDKDLENILEQMNIEVSSISCVITHAPHGNERSHIQHIHCYHHARKWSNKNKITFAFFSEYSPFSYQEIKILDKCKRATLFEVKKPFIFNTKKYKTVSFVIYAVEVYIDIKIKNQLLGVYKSQVHGLQDYKTYSNKIEYIFYETQYSCTLFEDLKWHL
jgi:LmbE family N-acetylglucosaminyl deacetylase